MGCIFVFKIDLWVLYIPYRRDTCKNLHVFVFTLAEDTCFRTRVERRHALYDLPRTKIMKDKHLEWRYLFYFTQPKIRSCWNGMQHCSWLSTIYFPFHASHKARVFRECENKNMKIFTSVASTWYVEDSKIDFKNENTAHGNRLLLFY